MNQYIGRLLDNRYEILEIIGTGGMAVVYKARCHRLNRLVAVKILKDEFSGDEEFRRRFRAEGEAVAMLSHPNIVQVFDVSSADNANYIVMELIDGISLKQYMEVKGVLNWKETLHFAMQIAKGLEHAHSRGIVHRDIKPHNVMVLKNGSVKVMDFGIARVMSKSNTLTKEALGSVHYISPEQAKGSYTDNRSDLYSLSVVMYEMMAGRPPYDGESPVAVAIQHINGGAPAPSTYNPNIPTGLEQIIRKGMSLETKDRYASATEMLADMEEFRKNPAIVFDYHSSLDDATRAIRGLPSEALKSAAERGIVLKPAASAVSTGTGRIRQNAADPGVQRRNTGHVPTAVNSNTSGKSAEAIRRAQLRRKVEERRQQERSRMATVAVVICSIVAIIAIFVFLAAILNGALLNKERELVEVPDLVGQFYSDSMLDRYPDFIISLKPPQYSNIYAKDEIIKQVPAGGSKVNKDSEIHITVSLGAEPAAKEMEYLVGVSEEEARSFLEKQNFVVLARKEASDIYEIGQVIRTDPIAGTKMTDGQRVSIWISTGPKILTAKMPDVMGLDQAKAEQVLHGLGFANLVFETMESDQPRGEVVYQSEKKNSEIDVNTEIYLRVSEGPKETEPAPTEEPTTAPTQAPETEPPETKPADADITMTVPFTLPIRDENYELTVYENGTLVVGPVQIAAGSNNYAPQLTGKGTVDYDLYIDGQYYQSQRVTFK